MEYMYLGLLVYFLINIGFYFFHFKRALDVLYDGNLTENDFDSEEEYKEFLETKDEITKWNRNVFSKFVFIITLLFGVFLFLYFTFTKKKN